MSCEAAEWAAPLRSDVACAIEEHLPVHVVGVGVPIGATMRP